MTLTTTTNTTTQTATGTNATFPFTFPIWAQTDLVVTSSYGGVSTTLVLNTNYSVNLVGSPSSGSITLLSGNPPAGTVITISRVLPLTQQTSLTTQGTFRAEDIENEFDRLTAVDQQLAATQALALTLPIGCSASPAFPSPVAAFIIGWDPTGTKLINYPTTLSAYNTALSDGTLIGNGDALVAVHSPLTGGTIRTQHQKNQDLVSLEDFGAVGDGVTDDSAAILKALTSGREIRCANKTYYMSPVIVTGVNNLSIDATRATFVGKNNQLFQFKSCNDFCWIGGTLLPSATLLTNTYPFQVGDGSTTCNRIVISGMTIDCPATPAQGASLVLWPVSKCVVDRCNFSAGGDNTIWAFYGDSICINNNVVVGNYKGRSICVQQVHGGVISGNYVSNGKGDGISIHGSDNFDVTGNSIFGMANDTLELGTARGISIEVDENATVNGQILTLGTVVPGGGYVNGTYTNVPLTGGAGSGAYATIVVAAGAVSTVTLTSPGLAYAVANTLSASNANLGGSGSGFSIPVGSIAATTGTLNNAIAVGTPFIYNGVFARNITVAGNTVANVLVGMQIGGRAANSLGYGNQGVVTISGNSFLNLNQGIVCNAGTSQVAIGPNTFKGLTQAAVQIDLAPDAGGFLCSNIHLQDNWISGVDTQSLGYAAVHFLAPALWTTSREIMLSGNHLDNLGTDFPYSISNIANKLLGANADGNEIFTATGAVGLDAPVRVSAPFSDQAGASALANYVSTGCSMEATQTGNVSVAGQADAWTTVLAIPANGSIMAQIQIGNADRVGLVGTLYAHNGTTPAISFSGIGTLASFAQLSGGNLQLRGNSSTGVYLYGGAYTIKYTILKPA